MAAAAASASPALAEQKNCRSCHEMEKKLVGPPLKDIAAKYAGQPGVVDKLAKKVIEGGSGVWGPIPMPANPQVNEAEAKQLVQWILSLK